MGWWLMIEGGRGGGVMRCWCDVKVRVRGGEVLV